jgi:putative tricarboxylic transport membrane protein
MKYVVIAAAAMVAGLPASAQFAPENAECIAPANPGGGWDFTCRTVGRLLTEEGLVDGPVQVTNMPGASGAVAYANVAADRADDENLIVATSTVGITNIAQGKYPAGADEMRWLGMLGADVAVVMVPADSEYESLGDLLDAMAADPAAIVAGGSSSIGGWDHIGVAVTDIGEIGGFIQSGDVKPLAVMSSDRLEAYPDIPTAKEQGIDAEGYNWRGFYVGGGVSDEAYDGWTQIMSDLYESEAWKQAATEAGLTPIWRGGQEFEEFVRESEQSAREISQAIGIIQ